MAKIGAKYPCFKSSAASAGIVLGTLNQCNVTIQLASGEIYGDDRMVENYSEFSSGSAALESTHISDENATILFGHTATNGRVVCKSGDQAPEGRFAYYRVVMVDGVKYFKAFGYYRTRPQLGNENDQTKANNITFSTDSLALSILTMEDGSWREYETYDNEADARAFVQDFCSVGADNVRLSALTVGTLSLSPAFSADVTAYTATASGNSSVITAAAEDSSATIVIKNGETTVNNGSAANWSTGENTLTITVTNGSAEKVYTVTVTK